VSRRAGLGVPIAQGERDPLPALVGDGYHKLAGPSFTRYLGRQHAQKGGYRGELFLLNDLVHSKPPMIAR
jgi:hypothetical protein